MTNKLQSTSSDILVAASPGSEQDQPIDLFATVVSDHESFLEDDGLVSTVAVSAEQTDTEGPVISGGGVQDDDLEFSEVDTGALNDAIDGKVAGEVNDAAIEGDLPVDSYGDLAANEEGSREGEDSDDAEALIGAFGTAVSGRDFINQKLRVGDLAKQLVKPPLKNGTESAEKALTNGFTDTSPAGANNPHETSGERMTLGAAALLMGARGITGLARMIDSGGSVVSSKLITYQMERSEKKLHEHLTVASTVIAKFNADGLSMLNDDELSETDRLEMSKQFFAKQENAQELQQLILSLDKAASCSSKMIRRGVESGEDGDQLLARSIEPLKDFVDKNEKVLDSTVYAGKSLTERLDNSINSLFEMLRDLLTRLAAMFKGNSSQDSTLPRMG